MARAFGLAPFLLVAAFGNGGPHPAEGDLSPG
jgi:hypothetical protein